MPREPFEGMADFQVKLLRLKRIAKKIAKRCVMDGLAESEKVVEASIPSKYAGAKQVFGRRIETRLSSEERAVGLIGWGVGRGRMHSSQLHTVSGGVGITANTVHWFILGTKNRRTRKGYNRGSMAPIMPGVFKRGMKASEAGAVAAMVRRYHAELAEFNK